MKLMPGREPLDRLNCFYLLCEGKGVRIYIPMFYEGMFGVLADQMRLLSPAHTEKSQSLSGAAFGLLGCSWFLFIECRALIADHSRRRAAGLTSTRAVTEGTSYLCATTWVDSILETWE